MHPLIILALTAGVPTLLALVLRVSAVHFFLSIATGSLFVTHLGDDTSLALDMMMRGQNNVLIASMGLLLVPVLLTILFLRKSATKNTVFLHVVPLVLSGLALGVLLLPFFDSNAQAQIFQSFYGDKFKDAQDVIIGLAGLSVLALAWLTGKPRVGKHAKHHK